MEEKYTNEERMAFIREFLTEEEYLKLSAHAMAMEVLINIAIKRAEPALYGGSK